MAMKAKERNRIKLLEFLGNPSNDFLKPSELSVKALGYKDHSGIFKCFTREELSEIFAEALEMRRKRYARELAKVDSALLKKAQGGETSAAKLVYQKFEGWSEKTDLNVKSNIGLQISDEDRILAKEAVDIVLARVLARNSGTTG